MGKNLIEIIADIQGETAQKLRDILDRNKNASVLDLLPADRPSVNAHLFPIWRIRHPVVYQPPLYWHRETATWRSEGYTVWSNVDKIAKFGKHDPGRNWESFGSPIPLYDEDEK